MAEGVEFIDGKVERHVVHTVRSAPGAWGAAIFGVLGFQCLLLLVVLLRLPPTGKPSNEVAKALQEVEELRRESDLDRKVAEQVAREETFHAILAQVKVAEDGRVNFANLIEENQRMRKRIDELEAATSLLAEVTNGRNELAEKLTHARDQNEKLTGEKRKLQSKIANYQKSLRETEDRFSRLQQMQDEVQSDVDAQDRQNQGLPIWLAAVVAIVAGMIGITPWILSKSKARSESRGLQGAERLPPP